MAETKNPEGTPDQSEVQTRLRFDREVELLAKLATETLLKVPELRGVTIIYDWAVPGEGLPSGYYSPREVSVESLASMNKQIPAFAIQLTRMWAKLVEQVASNQTSS